MRIMAMMGAGCAVLVLGACGSSGKSSSSTTTNSAVAARRKARAEFQKCSTQLKGVLDAESNLNSHLDVGMNYHDYTSAVGDVKAAYDQTPIHQMDFQCLASGVHAEAALNAYVKAAGIWDKCFSDINCNVDSIKPQLQKQWGKASSELQGAQSALQNLQNPSSASGATTPTTGAVSATPPPSTSTSTQSSLPKPPPGAQGAPANNSATTLPAWLGRGRLPQYWQVCGSGAQEVVTNGACGLVVRQVFVAALARSGHPPRQIMDQDSNTYTCQHWSHPGVWRCTNTHGVWAEFAAP